VIVEAPRDFALFLPMSGDEVEAQPIGKAEGLVSLRQVLDGAPLRDYLALCLMWVEDGLRENGVCRASNEYLLDITAASRHQRTKAGRTYTHFTTKARQSLEDNLALFRSLRVRVVGNLEAATGDPLVDEYTERREGKVRYYAHSRLVVAHMRRDYMRIPREVLKLSPEHIPLAIGLATHVRRGAVALETRQTSIRMTLAELANAAGYDLAVRVRRDGRKHYKLFAEAAGKVAEDGRIGHVTVAGDDADAIITLTPSESLRASYQPLLAAAMSQAKATKAARVRAKLPPKQ